MSEIGFEGCVRVVEKLKGTMHMDSPEFYKALNALLEHAERLRAELAHAKHSITKLMTRWPELDGWADVFEGESDV